MRDQENIVAVYMMASRFDGPFYTGVTADLLRRVVQHKNGTASAFTRKFKCTSLVWWEPHGLIVDAIRREKRIKGWLRQWKVELIEAANPHWEDLWETFWVVPRNPECDLRPWRTKFPGQTGE